MQLRLARVVRDNISTESFNTFAMADPSFAAAAAGNTSAGHLSVHFVGDHPADVPFLFEEQRKRIGPAAIASFAYHAAMVGALLFAISHGSTGAQQAPIFPQQLNNQIVWLTEPGPGGGGGGGGNRMQEPPRKAELPGKDAITVPVQRPPSMQLTKKEPDPTEQLNIPAKNMASAAESLPGALDAPPGPPTLSQGPGSGGGSGTGVGTGIGPGTGSGLGPGSGGGTGGGVYEPGSGVSNPRLLQQVRPQYTSDAMRAKVQGTAIVSCVVRTTGVPSDCEIARSLDPTFGLDQQAVLAAQKWRFAPGTLRGEPVNVRILIEMTFTLR